ncbi:DUF4013 domain-containing protein [uncultured Slackia sp.]|uniref:DUF4013 domain-containing protein n=1 Tax=uncultured Slackia sp. TaxID=665903 RepID=UPI0026E05CB5|nr:DUF4013 domain-containing protein [uncultured Slackia sp.]
MKQEYFFRAWRAVRSSDAWLGRVCLLALVSLIPVFGPVVVSGYLLGWARDAAWGMDNPMPKHIFGNEDGSLYRRGFFALVVGIAMVFAVLAGVFVLMSLVGLAAGLFATLFDGSRYAGLLAFPALFGSFGVFAASVVAVFAVQFFVWVALMRMSIYDTLSSAFQLGHVWCMIRRDPVGLLKIFFCGLLATLVVGAVMSVVWFVVLFLGMIVAMGVSGFADYSGISALGLGGVAVLGLVAALLFALAVAYVSVVCGVMVQTLVYRSLGYWTAQFDVARWGSQDDPLPLPYSQQAGDYGL